MEGSVRRGGDCHGVPLMGGYVGAVDVEVDGFRAILFIEVKHNSDNLVGKFIVNFGSKENDTFSVKAVVNVNPAWW